MQLAVEKPICVEKFSNVPQLGRFTLRDEGRCVLLMTTLGTSQPVADLSLKRRSQMCARVRPGFACRALLKDLRRGCCSLPQAGRRILHSRASRLEAGDRCSLTAAQDDCHWQDHQAALRQEGRRRRRREHLQCVVGLGRVLNPSASATVARRLLPGNSAPAAHRLSSRCRRQEPAAW